jgi:hypothetical protein
MSKDNGTGTSSQWGGYDDGTVEHLIGSPPTLWLANIIRGMKDAAWKCCHIAAMSTTTTMLTTTVRMMMGGSK